ncbi:alpha/beta hydrolase [Denitromonas ohlonensis]|uniref:alpha/beta hydrolase n=1 Tax=Denitromonas ohlonensis TaxID=3078508 RepID=UPI0016427A7B|nr:CocE/NonD family hydrolase [Denitromonas ohlonensis]
MEQQVDFQSEGATLRGVLITPDDHSGKYPVVVMAHGTSATIQMVAIEYARAFAQAGIAALIYDHRSFGRSGGEPRSEINPWVQCRGYVSAIDFALELPQVNPSKLALWGDSYTGGQVMVVSACDARAKVIVAQCPVLGPSAPSSPPSIEAMQQIRSTLQTGNVQGTPDTTTGPLPVVSPSQLAYPSLLAPIQAFRWFLDYGGRPGSGWINEAKRVLPPTPVLYSPFLCAPYVQAKVLFMVAPEDEMVHANYSVAQQAYELIPTEKRWYDIRGGHFGLLYHPGELFNEAIDVQVHYLRAALDA